jgi:CRP-like cAMP-binding protein
MEELRSALAAVGGTGRRSRLPKGSMVSLHGGHEGQAGLHLLLEGRMKTLRFSRDGRVIILDLLSAGDVFGEMSLVAGGRAEPTYAEALEDVEVETVPVLLVERVLGARPALALAMARLMGARRSGLERRLEDQIFEKVPTRLSRLLLELAERFGAPAGGGTILEIPLSQQDLGNLIGASREIVSLTLSDLRRRGALSMAGRRIVVHEDALRREVSARG